MIVNTQRLFVKLLSGMKISTVCDVGSMDGADSLTFRDALPESSIYAFEPNPENLRRMQADRALQERTIHIVPLAASVAAPRAFSASRRITVAKSLPPFLLRIAGSGTQTLRIVQQGLTGLPGYRMNTACVALD